MVEANGTAHAFMKARVMWLGAAHVSVGGSRGKHAGMPSTREAGGRKAVEEGVKDGVVGE